MAIRDLDIDVDVEVDGGELERVNQQANDLIDTLEKLDKTYHIDIDLDAAPVLAQLERLEQKLRSIDNDVNVDIDINSMGALAELSTIEGLLENIENDKIRIDFEVSTMGALSELSAFESVLETLEHNDFDIEVDMDIGGALAKVSTLESRIRELDNITVNIDVDIGAATAQLAMLQNQMTMLRMQRHIDIDVDTTMAMAQIAALQAQVTALQAQASTLNLGGGLGGGTAGLGSLGGFGIMTGVKIATLAIALPAVISAAQVAIGVIGTLGVSVGILAGGALALGSALTIGAGGIVGFGAVAVSSISALYQEGAKLTSQQQLLKAQTDKVSASWNGLKDALQPTVLSATTSGVKAINTLLDQGHPILKNAGTAVDGLMGSLNKSLKGNEMQDFFAMLKRDVGPLTTNLGNGLGNALKGVANTMTAFSPLTNWAAQGFENAMGRFSEWTAGLKDSDGLKTFMKYTEDNLPKIGSGLKDAAKGVGEFFSAFDVTASDGLDWFQDTMKDFSKWAGDLDKNDGFQNMLKDIKNDAPEIAKTIGDVTDNIVELSQAIDNISRTMSGDGIFGWLSDMVSGENFKDFNFFDFLEGGALNMGLEALGIDIDWSKILGFDTIGEAFGKAMSGLGEWFDGIEISVGDWFKNLDFGGVTRGLTEGLGDWFSNLNIGEKIGDMFSGAGEWFDGIEKSVGDWFKGLDFGGITRGLIDDVGNWFSNINIGESISGVFKNFDLGKINWKDFIPDFKWPDFGKFDFKSLIPKFKWPDLGSFSFKSLIPSFKWPSIGSFSWNSFISKFKWPSIGKFSWTSFISKFKWPSVGSFSWSKFITKFKWPKAPAFSWSNFISKFKWPKLPSLSWSSYISKFKWPKLPSFSWSSFISKFSWPKLPSFSWSSFIPKFSWPKISMPKISIPGFSSGLGRVPNDMTATIHKDEAVLPAHQASLLRNLGVIQGEGRYPGLNMNALTARNASAPTIKADLSSYQPTAASNNPTARVTPVANTKTNNNSKKEFNITINVDGSKNPEQTAMSIEDRLQNWVASLEDANPQVYEY